MFHVPHLSDTIREAAFHGQAVKTVAYLRVSTPQQDASSQRLAILEYARKHDLHIDDFIEATASGQASEKRRRLDELTSVLQRGDRLVVSELSRLGRSLGQVVAVLDALAKAGVAFVALKENIRVEGKRDIQTKVMTTLFALFAEVERDLTRNCSRPADRSRPRRSRRSKSGASTSRTSEAVNRGVVRGRERGARWRSCARRWHVSGRNGRMARAVALSARDVRRVGLTAHASRAVAVERQALPTAAVATLDNGVLRRVSRTPRKSLPHGGDPSPAAPDQGGLRCWPFPCPTCAGGETGVARAARTTSSTATAPILAIGWGGEPRRAADAGVCAVRGCHGATPAASTASTYEEDVLDVRHPLTIVRQLTEAGIDRDHADAIADGIRQAAEHGEHVTPETLRAEIAGVLTAISAAETRLTWRMLAVAGLVIAALRLLG